MTERTPLEGAAEPCTEEVDRVLASYPALFTRIVKLNPDAIAPNFGYESDVPVGAVCLRDAQSTFGQAIYALHQFCTEPVSHRRSDEPAGPLMAAWLERFYAEDAAMRLYNSAEHLANAIAMLRSIDSRRVAAEKSRSQWERVRKTLAKEAPQDPIHVLMSELRRRAEWRFAIAYRGNVVHQQPPILAGVGVSYRRRRRWNEAPDGWTSIRFDSNQGRHDQR